MTHRCIKPGCDNSYDDAEIDAYYCPSCNENRKKVAKVLDAKFKPEPQAKSSLQLYDEICQQKGIRFVNAKDLF